MLPSADQLFNDSDFIFQQDLAPAHSAKSPKSWLNDHGVGVLDWPANSPDLNPRENIWDIVKRKMRNKRPKNRVRIWRKEHESMDPSCLVSTVQAGGGGVMVWGVFLAHFGPLSTNWALFKSHCLPDVCCWLCPSLYDYSVPIFWCYFQQDNAPCHKAQIISNWFREHDNEFTLLKWPPQSPDLNPIEHLWDVVEREIRIMDVQPTNLQQPHDAIMSIWPKSLRNVSNTLITPQVILI